MRLASHVASYTKQVEQWLAANAPHLTRHDIATGRDAWTVAHRSGLTRQAYDLGRDVTDGHIQTALERVFPNATFNDRKVY
jgi:hypothetical protein